MTETLWTDMPPLNLTKKIQRKKNAIIERLRFAFTSNGKREFVPRDQVFPVIVVNCLLPQLKNK